MKAIAPVPELDEVPGRHLAARDVVHDDARQRRVRRIDEDRRQARRLQPPELLFRRHERDDDEPVGPVAAAEEIEGAPLAVGRLDVEEREVVRASPRAP